MSDWSAGYVTDVGYTYGYYSELNPRRATLPMLMAGLLPPAWENACELGFGQGVSVNVHAASSATQWWGTDFNPEQAACAQEMARASGSGARLLDEAFADFCHRQDLPDFDYIGLHGIWSWISDENRRLIVDFVRRKLRVGGVLYLSYNTLPGWAPVIPLRHLMSEHTRIMSAPGQPLGDRIGDAMAFTQKLLALEPKFARANPQLHERFEKMLEHNRSYLAHEYFNRDWEPMAYSQMLKWLGEAKLKFACSADYLSHIDRLHMTPESVSFLQGIADPNFRETVRDYIINQQFRKDYWVRGGRRATPLETLESIQHESVQLLCAPQDVQMQLTLPGSTAPIALQESVYRPLIDALADRKAHTVGDVAGALRAKKINHGQMVQAMMVLASRGDLSLVQSQATQQLALPRTQRLNRWFVDRARSSPEISFLASPVTGGAVGVPRFHQLFLAAHLAGARSAGELARSTWRTLTIQGQRIIHEGKPLDSESDNIAHLEADAKVFLQKQVPTLQLLKIMPSD